MEKLLLVDGSNLLFQMFFGMPARIVNDQGKAIQGVLGFVGALLKMIRQVSPTHLAVLFDSEQPNGRALADPSYKANRKNEDAPFSQLDDIYEALDFMNIRHTETNGCEADDLIACYALSLCQKMEVVIASWDSDFFQLLSSQISVLRYRGKNTLLCTPTYVEDRFGVSPALYADFKALTGDTADNIKGAPGIGPKTAAMLLKEFGSLKAILKNTPSIRKAAARTSILQNSEKLQINYQLIKLGKAVPLPFACCELAYCYNGITTNEALRGAGIR